MTLPPTTLRDVTAAELAACARVRAAPADESEYFVIQELRHARSNGDAEGYARGRLEGWDAAAAQYRNLDEHVDKVIGRFNEKITELERINEDLKAINIAKDLQIETLIATIGASEAKISALTDRLETALVHIKDLTTPRAVLA